LLFTNDDQAQNFGHNATLSLFFISSLLKV